MSEGWLEIEDPGIDAREVAQRVEERVSSRRADLGSTRQEDPAGIARALWLERFEGRASADDISEDLSTGWIATWLRDCEVVPRGYVIDWRLPVLGPIHALVRRIINAEVRRYLLPMLEKQSLLNRKVLETLDGLLRRQEALMRENLRLGQEIERLQGEIDRGPRAG